MIELAPLSHAAPPAVEALLDAAFGAGRHERTAYRIRGATPALSRLSFAAFDGAVLAGAIQCFPIRLAMDDGGMAPLTMVGPVAVAPDRQRDGIGRLLMQRMLAAAGVTGDDNRLMLIGDPEYYGRFFGFSAERTGGWRAPGPVERHRLLARGHGVPGRSGLLGPCSPCPV